MALQVVHPCLLQVAHIADAHHRVPHGKVEGEQLAQRGIVVQRGEHDVPSSVAQREDFVVRFAELGREHHAQQGQVGLPAHRERILPDAEAVDEHPRRAQSAVGFRLGRVVRVAPVVHHPDVQVEHRAEKQLQPRGRAELVVQGIAPVHQPSVRMVGLRDVAGVRGVQLEQVLCRHVAAHQAGHPQGLVGEARLGPLVFQRREVGLERVVVSRSYHGRAHHEACRPQGVLLCVRRQADARQAKSQSEFPDCFHHSSVCPLNNSICPFSSSGGVGSSVSVSGRFSAASGLRVGSSSVTSPTV